jgi:hypothetical protein
MQGWFVFQPFLDKGWVADEEYFQMHLYAPYNLLLCYIALSKFEKVQHYGGLFQIKKFQKSTRALDFFV